MDLPPAGVQGMRLFWPIFYVFAGTHLNLPALAATSKTLHYWVGGANLPFFRAVPLPFELYFNSAGSTGKARSPVTDSGRNLLEQVTLGSKEHVLWTTYSLESMESSIV